MLCLFYPHFPRRRNKRNKIGRNFSNPCNAITSIFYEQIDSSRSKNNESSSYKIEILSLQFLYHHRLYYFDLCFKFHLLLNLFPSFQFSIYHRSWSTNIIIGNLLSLSLSLSSLLFSRFFSLNILFKYLPLISCFCIEHRCIMVLRQSPFIVTTVIAVGIPREAVKDSKDNKEKTRFVHLIFSSSFNFS